MSTENVGPPRTEVEEGRRSKREEGRSRKEFKTRRISKKCRASNKNGSREETQSKNTHDSHSDKASTAHCPSDLVYVAGTGYTHG